MDPDASVPADQPSVFNYVLSFLLVGVAWGFTTPFIRRAAADFNARQEAAQKAQSPQTQSARSTTEEQELQQQSHAASGTTKNGDEDEEEEESGDEDQPLTSNARSTTAAAAAGGGGSTRVPAWMKPKSTSSWLTTKIITVFWTVVNLLRTPAYSIPLIINLTGSIWFFLLVGKHGMSPLSFPLSIVHDCRFQADINRIVVNCPIGEFECIPLHRPRGVVC